MRNAIKLRQFAWFLPCIFLIEPLWAQQHVLNIKPVFQTTAVYCWLATGEMVFNYYGIPENIPDSGSYQCGEARGIGAVQTGLLSGSHSFAGSCWNNCWQPQCVTGAGSLQGIYNLVVQYPQIVALTNGNTKFFPHPKEVAYPLTPNQVKSEIDNGRPIIAGISPGVQYLPPGVSEHAVLIVGYANGGNTLIVNDPYPYPAMQLPSYVQFGGQRLIPGRFEVSWQAMVHPIAWRNTIYDLQAADGLNCAISATAFPWSPPGTAQVNVDNSNLWGFNFGPGGSTSLHFLCQTGHHQFQFSIFPLGAVPTSCTGSFDVNNLKTDFSPLIRVAGFGQVVCSLQ